MISMVEVSAVRQPNANGVLDDPFWIVPPKIRRARLLQ